MAYQKMGKSAKEQMIANEKSSQSLSLIWQLAVLAKLLAVLAKLIVAAAIDA